MLKAILKAAIVLMVSNAVYAEVTEVSHDTALTPGAKLLINDKHKDDFYIADKNDVEKIKTQLHQSDQAEQAASATKPQVGPNTTADNVKKVVPMTPVTKSVPAENANTTNDNITNKPSSQKSSKAMTTPVKKTAQKKPAVPKQQVVSKRKAKVAPLSYELADKVKAKKPLQVTKKKPAPAHISKKTVKSPARLA
ncbi:MAG TPA: hypothetical protein VHZ76_09720 [Gammaproteobacteria bacterium]|jgi:hypothetical protein|nr:hypothetical protein [Gammaproteobacteria bacterium]